MNEENNNLPVIIENIQDSSLSDDFSTARNNILDTVKKAQKALDDMIAIAHSSQHPAAYDVLSTMIKNTSQLSKDMMEIYKRKSEIDTTVTEETNNSTGDIVNNNVFVGSTSELQTMLENIKNQKNES